MQPARSEISAILQQVLDTNFETIVRFQKLPDDVQKLLPAQLANPNEKFDATDLTSGKPSRRLIAAGHSAKCDLVCYEHGGAGYHIHLVVFNSDKRGTQRVFEGSLLKDSKDAATVANIKNLIQSGTMTDVTKLYEEHPEF